MSDLRELQRVTEIETAYAEQPWIADYLRKDIIRELKTEDDLRPNFLKFHSDDFLHMEVMWLFGQNGEYLGEMDDFDTPKTLREFFSFTPRHETILEAIQRMKAPVYFILKNRNFTHAVLYKAPEGESLLEFLILA